MNTTNNNNTLLRAIALFLGIVIFLLGGAGVTKVAADASIPGDALYPVKTGFEQARLSLAQDAGDRAQMKMAFAAQRLEEIDSLVREGRYREIRQAVIAFEAGINSALFELETVSKTDPTRAAAIAGEIASALSRYARILSDLSAVAPDAVKGEVIRALDTTQLAGDLSQANSNTNDDNSNDDSTTNTNDGNGNDDNSNDDSSANTNDDNSNDDSSANTNDDNSNDDNTNTNANDDNSNDDNSSSDNGIDDNGGMDDANANTNDDSTNAGNTNDDSGTNTHDDNSQDDNGGDNRGSDGGNDDRKDNSGKGSGGSDDKTSDQ